MPRYSGSLDTSFGNGGKLTTDLGQPSCLLRGLRYSGSLQGGRTWLHVQFICAVHAPRRLMSNSTKEQSMTKRLKQVLLGVGALAALALGGSSLAQAGTTTVKSTLEPTSAPDRDTIQAGDQTTPDTPAKSASVSTAKSSSVADTPESGTPDTPAEAPSSETANDGPGGHADPPGNVDHQAGAEEK
jgi:hypothetical protein